MLMPFIVWDCMHGLCRASPSGQALVGPRRRCVSNPLQHAGASIGPTLSCNEMGGLTLVAPHAGVHWVMLGWNKTKDFNLAWLRKDLAAVDRARTPWLIAVIHPPWYALATNYNSQVPMSTVDGAHALAECGHPCALVHTGNPKKPTQKKGCMHHACMPWC